MQNAICALTLSLAILLAGCGGSSSNTSATTSTPPAAVSISTSSVSSASMGTAYTQPISVSGGTAPYTFALASGSTLPAGLTLSASQGTITGTPAASGTFSFTIQVTDSSKPALSASTKYSLTIAPLPIAISTIKLPGATAGEAYMQTLEATGGNQPYVWTMASGSLPAGVALSSTGSLSGMPTAAELAKFTVQVADASTPQLTANASFSIAVAPSPSGPLAIATSSLPAVNLNQAYSAQISAMGGTAPYTWSIIGGEPAGLSLDPSSGVLSGTSPYPFKGTIQVHVADAGGQTAQTTLNISCSPNGLLKGQYFMHLQLYQLFPGLSQVDAAAMLASLTLDGNGNIIDGIADYADDDGDEGLGWNFIHLNGTYQLNFDGTGTMTLVIPGFAAIDSQTASTYTFSLASGSRQASDSGVNTSARVLLSGAAGIQPGGAGSGEMQLQQLGPSNAFLQSQNIVFGWQGETCHLCGDSTQDNELAMAGVLNLDQSQALTWNSQAKIALQSDSVATVMVSGQLAGDGTILSGSSQSNFGLYGRSVLSSFIVPSYTANTLPTNLAVYVVDSTHAYALGISNGSLLYGPMQVQQTAELQQGAMLSGSFVTWGTSQDAADAGPAGIPFSQTDASVLIHTVASGTSLTATGSVNAAGTITPFSTAAESAVTNPDGAVVLSSSASLPTTFLWLAAPNTGFGFSLNAQGMPMMLTVENQTATNIQASTLLGAYTYGVAGSHAASYPFFAGVVSADGTGNLADGELYLYGEDALDQFTTPISLSGSYTVDADGTGLLQPIFTYDGQTGPSRPYQLYVVSPTRALLLDSTNLTNPALGELQQ